MRVFYGLDHLDEIKNPVFTTGTFDGVHVGHRKIIEQLNSIADKVDGESVLFTFHPHPRMVVFPDQHDLKLILKQEEKIKRLQEAGLKNLIVFPFTKAFSKLSALDYVKEILVDKIKVNTVVVGHDHRFGKNREGDYNQLLEFGRMFDFRVEEIPAVDIDQVNVSSTKIRNALFEGDIETANKYLTYPFVLGGRVVKGKRLGSTIQFPTANIEVNDIHKLIPQNGVYVVEGTIRNKEGRIKGMMNIGTKPTVTSSNRVSIEVHFFDWNDNIYGEYVEVSLLKRIRNEQKFENIEALKQQLHKDKLDALSFFAD